MTLGKATKTAGRTRLAVTDEAALLEWLQKHHPTEIVVSPNQAYLKALESMARNVGAVIDNQGEIIPGVELVHGEPYVSVRKAPERRDRCVGQGDRRGFGCGHHEGCRFA
jgi:hypothetical protein